MVTTSRFEINEVREAYRKTGFTPLQGSWLRCKVGRDGTIEGDQYAHALVALICAADHPESDHAARLIHGADWEDVEVGLIRIAKAIFGLSIDYIEGFVAGWDRDLRTPTGRSARFGAGYNDGRDVEAGINTMRGRSLGAGYA